MQPITVTNKYFADQNTYIVAAGLPKNTKFKKADLYAEIETWNRVCADAAIEEPETYAQELVRVQADLNAATFDEIPTNVVEITTDNGFDELFANWQQSKTEKATSKTNKVIEWTVEDIAIAQSIDAIEDPLLKASAIAELVDRYNMATVAIQSGINSKKVRRYYHAYKLISVSQKILNAYNDGLISWNKIVAAVQKSNLSVAEQEAKLGFCC
jgi:hypothetical protein